MTSYFHTMGPMGGRTSTALCTSSLAPVDVATGRARAAAAHWLAGSADRLAGARQPGRALAVRRTQLLPGTVVHASPCASWVAHRSEVCYLCLPCMQFAFYRPH